jgi:hypothetical protein
MTPAERALVQASFAKVVPEVREAWLACYAAVAGEMIAGAQTPQR